MDSAMHLLILSPVAKKRVPSLVSEFHGRIFSIAWLPLKPGVEYDGGWLP